MDNFSVMERLTVVENLARNTLVMAGLAGAGVFGFGTLWIALTIWPELGLWAGIPAIAVALAIQWRAVTFAGY